MEIKRKSSMRLAFYLILLIPAVVQAFVTWRCWQLMPFPVWGRAVVALLMWVCFALFFLALMPKLDTLPYAASTLIYNVGTSWVIMMFYLFLLFVVLSLLQGFHLMPRELMKNSLEGTLFVTVLMVAVFVYGYHHYTDKHREPLALLTDKTVMQPGKLFRIIMTSDWHLGYHNRRTELARWIDMLNAENPDIILVAGDIIDRSLRPLEEEKMYEEFRRLKCPIVACLGNHEYFAGERSSQHFYEAAGIRLLRDDVMEWGPLCIIGRDDRTNDQRAPLAELMRRANNRKYTILLDHQPYHLEEAEQANIDFQFSGHTHYGQVWPASWITDALYECAFGSHQRGDTQYYVSSGLGIWGGKFRIGTRSEYVVADLNVR